MYESGSDDVHVNVYQFMDALIVCVCLLQAIINEQRQVEVAKQIAEKQKVEQQKLKDLAVIDKLKELEVRACTCWLSCRAIPMDVLSLFPLSLSPSLSLPLSLPLLLARSIHALVNRINVSYTH